MNIRILIRLGTWIVGSVLFIAASFEVARLYVHGMQAWAIHYRASRGNILELQLLGWPVFGICLIAGALYATALARPSVYGGLPRIWLHLAATYLLFVLGCVPAVRAAYITLPNFPREFELSAYLFVLLSLPIVCVVLGILAWVHLAFQGR